MGKKHATPYTQEEIQKLRVDVKTKKGRSDGDL